LKGYIGGNEVFNSAQNINGNLSAYGAQGAYAFTNLQAGFTGKSGSLGYDVSIWLKNAFDRHYLNSISSSGGTLSAVLSDPRTFGTTLRLNF
jgi:iron complex outermembrane receptor protein